MTALSSILRAVVQHKDAILAFAAISASFSAILGIVFGLWQTNRTLSTNREIAQRNFSSNLSKEWIATFTEHVGRILSLIASIHLPGTEPGSKERQDQLLELQYHQAMIQLLSRSQNVPEGIMNLQIKEAIREVAILIETPVSERDFKPLNNLTSQIVQECRLIVANERRQSE